MDATLAFMVDVQQLSGLSEQQLRELASSLIAQIAHRDQALIQRDQAIVQRDELIARKNQDIARKDQDILYRQARLTSSPTSWRS